VARGAQPGGRAGLGLPQPVGGIEHDDLRHQAIMPRRNPPVPPSCTIRWTERTRWCLLSMTRTDLSSMEDDWRCCNSDDPTHSLRVLCPHASW
jgi:hypothetical protein